jgi:hypothetical protein
VRVLAQNAEINGYKAPARVDVTGTRIDLVLQQQAADAQALADLDRLTIEELREYQRLEAKAQGLPQGAESNVQPSESESAK